MGVKVNYVDGTSETFSAGNDVDIAAGGFVRIVNRTEGQMDAQVGAVSPPWKSIHIDVTGSFSLVGDPTNDPAQPE